MIGLETLKEEMEKRGCNKAQIESKTAPIVLDIVAGSGTLYSDTKDAEAEYAVLQEKIAKEERMLQNLNDAKRRLEGELQELQSGLNEASDRQLQYIRDWNEALKNCETPEARDAMRTAQVFMNSVNVDSSYDNYAFILALGAILSRNNIPAEFERFEKVVPDAAVRSSEKKKPVIYR